MKICWDTLEGMYLSRNGNFRKNGNTYVYKDLCIKCGEPYLTTKSSPSNFCNRLCARKPFSIKDRKKMSIARVGKNNPFFGKTHTTEAKQKMSITKTGKNNPMFGKNHSFESKQKIAIANTGKIPSAETRKKISITSSARIHTVESRKKISVSNTGKTHTAETRKKLSGFASKRVGSLASNWKGGGTTLGVVIYEACKDTLGLYEDIRKQEGTEILEAKCVYCGCWFAPTYNAIRSRLRAINNLNCGEQRLYCSENCKLACPTYRRRTYPKGFKHTTSREVSTYLRQIVLERDNWTCQICGKTIKEAQLHVHHMDPVAQNPMFQNDIDSCVTLCKGCHKMVHSRRGCRYVDLQCKKKFNDINIILKI